MVLKLKQKAALSMGSVKTVQSSYWKTTSPIPPDPVYENNTANIKQPVVERRNPIPNDPIYQSASEKWTNSPVPRIKPEALRIARSHQGKELAYLFNPAFQVIPVGVRPTHRESKDFNKENFKKIKEIQKTNREKRVESSRQTPVKAVYKPTKFDHVESKVSRCLETPNAPRRSTTEGRIQRSNSLSDVSRLKRADNEFKKNLYDEKPPIKSRLTVSGSNSARPNSIRPNSAQAKEQKEEKVLNRKDRPSSAVVVGSHSKLNERPKSHIIKNKYAVKNSSLKRSPSMTALDELKKKKEKDLVEYKRGSMPKYLQKRQEEWKKEEEARVASIPDPTIPEGHSLMPEADRVETLSLLKKSKGEMTHELQSLPLSKDTMRVKNRRDKLERKLQEIDAALKIFSRPRVFIKDD